MMSRCNKPTARTAALRNAQAVPAGVDDFRRWEDSLALYPVARKVFPRNRSRRAIPNGRTDTRGEEESIGEVLWPHASS